jgi:hypothetical protein
VTPRARLAPHCSVEDAKLAIERFLTASTQPALFEPGEPPLAIAPSNFQIDAKAGKSLTISAWDDSRNLVRSIKGVVAESRGRLELEVERFGKKPGAIVFADLALARNDSVAKRSGRLINREHFRRALSRQFPGWTIVEITSEPDLEHSLSPSYPRAYLRKGRRGFAALAATHAVNGALTFGLLWLDYLRQRERKHTVEGLALFVPIGEENDTSLRLRYLDPSQGRFGLFVLTEDGYEERVDLADTGNIDTRVERRGRRILQQASSEDSIETALRQLPFVETIEQNDNSLSFRVRGLEFARRSQNEFSFGFETKRAATTSHMAEIKELAALMNQLRSSEVSAGAAQNGPLYKRNPERWLESQVRANLEALDSGLLPDPIYGQVPALSGEGREVLDLLTAGRDGRLAIIELKASEDIQLPVQGLDYWIRVKHHLDRGDFESNGYFPGIALRTDAPRLLLVSPALAVHPANETVLKYFAPEVPAEQIGLGVEWRKGVKVMFRKRGNAQ